MSRIGKQPVGIPDGVTVTVQGAEVSAKGPKGELSITLAGPVSAAVEDGHVVVSRSEETRDGRSFHGLARSLIANMVEGVSAGFSKKLEIQGVGFRAAVQGQMLTMTLGFSKPVEYPVPDDVKIEVEGGTLITVSGVDKQQVGDSAARIRSFFKAEPYKGKGIRYVGEHVKRKVGKTVA